MRSLLAVCLSLTLILMTKMSYAKCSVIDHGDSVEAICNGESPTESQKINLEIQQMEQTKTGQSQQQNDHQDTMSTNIDQHTGVDKHLLRAIREAVLKQRSGGGMMIGGPLNGSIIPDRGGGMVVGGYLNGSIMPGCNGGMFIGGILNGTIMPGCGGGMIIGGPLNGSVI